MFRFTIDNIAEIDFLIQKEGMVISMKNFGLENGTRSVPLYAVFCLV